jgi:hypothetical protein
MKTKVWLLLVTLLLLASSLMACGTGLGDKEARQLMYDLLERDEEKSQVAIDMILESGDTQFVSVFIEMMRAGQVGLLSGPLDLVTRYTDALATLSGEDFGYNWADWVEWYGNTDLEPPPGFTGWKGDLLSRIDPGFADFMHDEAESLIRVEEIMWGGVRVDGIPALDNAEMLPGDLAEYVTPEEPVFGIFLNGDARAYPLRIMDWHEMANDVVGGVPVSLSYCTLCGAAIAYDGRASDGQTYTFGSSGLLYRSNKLMYDRQTRTIWNQFTGEPVLGELVGKDVELSLIPVVLTSWQAWQEQHPETLVLDIDTGYERLYVPGGAYGHYFSSDETMFPVAQRSELLETKEQIYALNIDGVPKAYAIDILAEEQVINDVVGDTPVVLVATRDTVEVEGLSLRQRSVVTYTAGSEVRAFQRGEETFRPGPDADSLLDEAGRPWQVSEEALIGPEGERAPRLSGHLSYWFGWYAFFPNTEVYGQ